MKGLALTSTTMRTTKNLTISLPPAMLRDMERVAKRENRTLSELVRENFRRAQQQTEQMDIYRLISRIAPPPPEIVAMRQEAKRNGTDKLTMAQINREVRAVRNQHDKKKNSKAKSR
jgi:Arc/MetJ-type ribon-helix-helix transcriptional regulator